MPCSGCGSCRGEGLEGLKDWVATIAGIVVFAGLLEMLVPPGGLKRYVQLAMGLLILLTLLKPVMTVLQHTRDLAWETEAAWQAPNLALSSVLSQAERIREGSRERQVLLYQTRLEETAAQRASNALGGRLVVARVTLGKQPDDGSPPPIEAVVLEVAPGSSRPAGATGEAGAPSPAMEPVQPVEIKVGAGQPAAPAAPPPADLDPKAAREAQQAVAALLEVPEDRVTVRSKS